MKKSTLLTVMAAAFILLIGFYLGTANKLVPSAEKIRSSPEDTDPYVPQVGTKSVPNKPIMHKPAVIHDHETVNTKFPEQYSDVFLDYLAILRNSTNTQEVLIAVDAVLKDANFTKMVKSYLKSRNPVNFPNGWGFALLAESWQDFSISEQYYDLTMDTFLDQKLDLFGRIMLVVSEANWTYMEAILLDAASDEDPEVRFSVALALSKSESSVAKELFAQLRNDENAILRAAVSMIESGNGQVLKNTMSFRNVNKLYERNKRVPAGTPMKGHFDPATGEIVIDEETKRK